MGNTDSKRERLEREQNNNPLQPIDPTTPIHESNENSVAKVKKQKDRKAKSKSPMVRKKPSNETSQEAIDKLNCQRNTLDTAEDSEPNSEVAKQPEKLRKASKNSNDHKPKATKALPNKKDSQTPPKASTPKKKKVKVEKMENTDFVRVKKARPAVSKNRKNKELVGIERLMKKKSKKDNEELKLLSFSDSEKENSIATDSIAYRKAAVGSKSKHTLQELTAIDDPKSEASVAANKSEFEPRIKKNIPSSPTKKLSKENGKSDSFAKKKEKSEIECHEVTAKDDKQTKDDHAVLTKQSVREVVGENCDLGKGEDKKEFHAVPKKISNKEIPEEHRDTKKEDDKKEVHVEPKKILSKEIVEEKHDVKKKDDKKEVRAVPKKILSKETVEEKHDTKKEEDKKEVHAIPKKCLSKETVEEKHDVKKEDDKKDDNLVANKKHGADNEQHKSVSPKEVEVRKDVHMKPEHVAVSNDQMTCNTPLKRTPVIEDDEEEVRSEAMHLVPTSYLLTRKPKKSKSKSEESKSTGK